MQTPPRKAVYRTSRRAGATGGFTFAELLVVMTVIVILISVAAPAIRGLSGGAGRRGAVNNVLNGIEQTRSTAVLEGVPAYFAVADLTKATAGANDPAIVEQYHYKAFAIFRDDSAGGPMRQVSPWRRLPPGIGFRVASELDKSGSVPFDFPPGGQGATMAAPFLKFNALGEVEQTTPATGPISIQLYEGFARINQSNSSDTATNAKADDLIRVARFTGRATYQVVASQTANP